ncbi:RNA polymerase sigma factor (modular protein) [Candidatus Sulfotelmatobacter sp. SbA7]|nr:RNA polymerase sigma factor (modular protein) [Candidatus Sulfotelmatobacter sp. SbA7]
MAASDTPDPRSVTDSRENTSARLPVSEEAQLSPPNGVSTNVSSVAIDRGILDRGLLNLAGTCSSAAASRANSVVSTDVAADAAVSDVDAMLRVKTGDETAFAYLVEKYRRPMVGFMYRMCHNPSTAEELAQEVFLRVYRSRTSYEPSAKFTTWLYRIATNLAVNYARDTRHERPENTLRLDEPDRETGNTPDLADDSVSAEEQILKRERLAAIRGVVNGLPERQRIAVIMHKYQQMDYRQIAGVLKLSESATKSLLYRAYETLREQLKEFVSGK